MFLLSHVTSILNRVVVAGTPALTSQARDISPEPRDGGSGPALTFQARDISYEPCDGGMGPTPSKPRGNLPILNHPARKQKLAFKHVMVAGRFLWTMPRRQLQVRQAGPSHLKHVTLGQNSTPMTVGNKVSL